MEELEFDILIIGAGAAGLTAALEIALAGKKVAVIEAKEKTGGRIATVEDDGHTVELGAEFIHGNLPLTKKFLKKAGVETYTINGSIWQHKDGYLKKQYDFIEDHETLEKKFRELKEDKPVATFLQEDLGSEDYSELRFSVKNYVEGYYAADTAKASTAALCEEWIKGDEEQYRIEGGYGRLIAYLEKRCRKAGVGFFLSQPVYSVQWKKDSVMALTKDHSFAGKKALITISIGVLQQEGITFYPAIPEVKEAVQKLGFGHVLKVLLRFKTPFWKEPALTIRKDLGDMSFLFSKEEVPTWWTHFPKNEAVLTGWLGGPGAASFSSFSGENIKEKTIHSLRRIFDIGADRLQQMLEKMYFINWSADPHFCGAYSYEVVGGGEVIQKMQQPVEETLFFAGEGLQHGRQIGTVEGALQNGREAAHRLLQHFSA